MGALGKGPLRFWVMQAPNGGSRMAQARSYRRAVCHRASFWFEGDRYRAGRKGEGKPVSGRRADSRCLPKCRDRRGSGTCSPARPEDCGPEGPWADLGVREGTHFRASRPGDRGGSKRRAAAGSPAWSRSPSRWAPGSPRVRGARKGSKEPAPAEAQGSLGEQAAEPDSQLGAPAPS